MCRLVLLLSLASFGPSVAAQTASFQGLSTAPGESGIGIAHGVSADGAVVVGRAAVPDPDRTAAFRWTAADGMTTLGQLPNGALDWYYAYATSADGAVVVGFSHGPSNPYRAFRWTAADGMVDLDVSGGMARAVSANGSVVVVSPSGPSGPSYRWTADDGAVGIGLLPGGSYSLGQGISADGTVIVGSGSRGNDTEAFRWTAEGGMVGLGDLPGGTFDSRASGVSADGTVVVGSGSGANGYEAVRWTASDGMVGLGGVSSEQRFSYAADASADGSVIVGVGTARGEGETAFRWTTEQGLQRIDDLLASAGVDLTGWRLRGAFGVSDDGTVIVGYGVDPQRITRPWRAVIPVGATVNADRPPGIAPDLGLRVAPNPAADRATFRVTLPTDGPVRLALYDVLGREVAVAVDGWRAAGPHEVVLSVATLPPGVYVVRFVAGAQTATRHVTVAR